ncbi:hypothetical protein MKMG_02064 [Methanogenium sp. MK-MG]|nr:hypothetical protein MKMG_02064 [Methanogenium sp. MK-MG]
MPCRKNQIFREIDETAAFCIDGRAVGGHFPDRLLHPAVFLQLVCKQFRVSAADDIPVGIRQAVMYGAEKNRLRPLCPEDVEEIVVVKIKRLIKGHADSDVRCIRRAKHGGLLCRCGGFLCDIKEPVNIDMIPDDPGDRMDFIMELLFLRAFEERHQPQVPHGQFHLITPGNRTNDRDATGMLYRFCCLFAVNIPVDLVEDDSLNTDGRIKQLEAFDQCRCTAGDAPGINHKNNRQCKGLCDACRRTPVGEGL